MEQKLQRSLEISWPCPFTASPNIKPSMITSAVVDGPELTHQNLPEHSWYQSSLLVLQRWWVWIKLRCDRCFSNTETSSIALNVFSLTGRCSWLLCATLLSFCNASQCLQNPVREADGLVGQGFAFSMAQRVVRCRKQKSNLEAVNPNPTEEQTNSLKINKANSVNCTQNLDSTQAMTTLILKIHAVGQIHDFWHWTAMWLMFTSWLLATCSA